MLDDSSSLSKSSNSSFEELEGSEVRANHSPRELLRGNRRTVQPILNFLSRRERHKKSL
jgi:hypothetical protein